MQGSNGHNNGGNGSDDSEDSGNDGGNIVRLPTPEQRAEQARQPQIRTTIFMGPAPSTPGRGAQTHVPMINLPPMTKFLVLILLGIELALKLVLAPEQQYWVIAHFGFIPAYYTGETSLSGFALAGPFTYAFLHGSWGHVGINVVMMMAFGSGLERWMGWRRLAILMLASSLIAAFIHFLFSIGSDNPVIGASGAISGMFAAALVMLQQTQNINGSAGRFGLWPLVAIWIGITVLFGMIGGPGGENIAWVAHIGGFLAGFVLIQPVMRLKV